jgi:DNA (cytosine-5)-methyltransferase 1
VNEIYPFIEEALRPLAEQYTPEGTLPKALAHQWTHALVNGTPFFAATKGVKASQIKELLQKAAISQDISLLKDALYRHIPIKPPLSSAFKFIDLFAGIGGMRIGFQQAGGTCVFSSEFERHAQATYFENHGDYPFGDITKIDPKLIPNHDVLVAGFPCQPFSHAGLKLGIDDTRGTLFHNIAEILKCKKPAVAVLENVRGLISHDKGNTLRIILKTMLSMGYCCNINSDIILNGTLIQLQNEAKKMILKSIDFGVPQNRQRIFIVLWKNKKINNFTYPEKLDINVNVGSILEKTPDPKYTISDRLWLGHQNRRIRNEENGKGFGFLLFDKKSPYVSTISARYYKDGSEALIAQKNKNPRKLTPREAARLQGFPENFILNTSSVNAYKQFGNSVTTSVVGALSKNIFQQLLES